MVDIESQEFHNWMCSCQNVVDQLFSSASLTCKVGKKYIKIIFNNYGQNSVWAFVNIENGDILKAASWKAPAKHARGNLFDEHKGMSMIHPTGPAYLR